MTEEVERIAADCAESLLAMERDGRGCTDDGDCECAECWLTHSLEIARVDRTTGQGTDLLYVEVLVTYGGPNVWVRLDDDGWAQVRVHWGSESARATCRVPRVADSAVGLVECLEVRA